MVKKRTNMIVKGVNTENKITPYFYYTFLELLKYFIIYNLSFFKDVLLSLIVSSFYRSEIIVTSTTVPPFMVLWFSESTTDLYDLIGARD